MAKEEAAALAMTKGRNLCKPAATREKEEEEEEKEEGEAGLEEDREKEEDSEEGLTGLSPVVAKSMGGGAPLPRLVPFSCLRP